MKITVGFEQLVSTGAYENKKARVDIQSDELADLSEEALDAEIANLFSYAKYAVKEQLGFRQRTITTRDSDD